MRCIDAEVRAFALSVKDKETGRIGIDALKGTLGRFGAAYKTIFKDSLDNSGLLDSDGGSWLSIMTQRARVAHDGQPATCSLADLRLFYNDIRLVLGFFCNGLGLVSTEVATISSLIVMPAAPAAAAPVTPAPP
jgi:hypothetical protein